MIASSSIVLGLQPSPACVPQSAVNLPFLQASLTSSLCLLRCLSAKSGEKYELKAFPEVRRYGDGSLFPRQDLAALQILKQPG